MGDDVTLLLRLLGTRFCFWPGMGGGFAAAARAENSRRQLHSFARLLTYLAERWTHRRSPDRSYYAAQRRTRRLPFFVPHRGRACPR